MDIRKNTGPRTLYMTPMWLQLLEYKYPQIGDNAQPSSLVKILSYHRDHTLFLRSIINVIDIPKLTLI